MPPQWLHDFSDLFGLKHTWSASEHLAKEHFPA